MEATESVQPEEQKNKRNIIIRILAGIFWFLVTVFVGHFIIGGVIGGMAGAQISGTVMSVGEAAGAGAAAGQQASAQFMAVHGGKVFLIELIVWLGLLITGKYPWVSKIKN